MELLNNEIKIPFKFNLKCKCNSLAGLDWRYFHSAFAKALQLGKAPSGSLPLQRQ